MIHVVRKFIVALFGVVALFALLSPPASAQSGDDQGEDERTILAFVRNQGVEDNPPIEGVAITVLDASGKEVATGETDADGRAMLTVSGRQDYTVTADPDTLPDGIAFQEGVDEVVITGDSFTTTIKTVTFNAGERQVETVSFFEKLAQRLTDGTRLGLLIAIMSVGLSLVFGTTGLTNFAHAEMVTFGGVIALVLNVSGLTFLGWLPFVDDRGRIPLVIGAVITMIAGGGLGLLLNWGIFGRLRQRGYGLATQMVVSIGLGIALKYLFLHRIGGDRRPLRDFATQRAWEIGPVSITPRDFATTVISLVVLVIVALSLQRTRLGKATRAVSDNAALASATGINSERIIRVVWFLAGALAALGGVFSALDELVSWEMGGQLLFVMFAGITLGGLGSAYGALAGGFVVGLFVELATFVVPTELKNAPALGVLILVLLVRPQGMFGRAERVG